MRASRSLSLRNAVRLLTRGPSATSTSGSEATVCFRSRAMMVSAENRVGLILAPLRTPISVMVPEFWADCTPESEGMHVTCGPPSRTRACTTAVLYCDTTAYSRKLFLLRPQALNIAENRRKGDRYPWWWPARWRRTP